MSKGMAPREVENRATPLEIRSIGSGLPKIAGYAAVFSPARSQDLGGFVEVVENRAFVKSQNDGWPMVRATYEHRDLLGTVAAGTLRLSTDSKGLEYEVDLPETSTGRDVYALTQRGDLRSSSWSFQVYDQDFTYENGTTVRHLTSVRLLEVSAVSNPAYPDATLGLRSLAAQFSCDPEDVFTMARSNQLSKLFVRTDTPRKSGRQALLELMKLKPNGEYHKPLTPARARAQLTRLMTPPPCEAMTPQQQYLARLPYETASSIGYDE